MEPNAASGTELAENLSEVIGRIYDCALDPAQWPLALAAISAFIKGNRVRLFLFNANAAQPDDGKSIGEDRAFNHAFDKDAETLASIKYGFVVAELDKAMTLAEILGISGGRDVNGRLPYDNRFYREWMEPRGAHDALAVLAFKTPDRFGGLAMTRSTPLPPFTQDDKSRMGLIAPHVRRALTISDLIAGHTLARSQFADVIDALATPVAIVDRNGRIEHANAAASQLIEAKTILAPNGMLQAAGLDADDSQGRAFTLGGRGGAGLIATMLPLAAGDGAKAVFFHRAPTLAQLPGEAFAKLYGLTGTELRIMMLLAEGLGVGEVAARIGSATETVRWHLKNLRAKTGCSRISQLAQLAREAVSPVIAERLQQGARSGRQR